MKKEEVISLQNVQLEIMDEIHRVCLKNELRYYLIGGSALGAVRHKGIIPWDVDIDIAMPRADYESLIHRFANDFSSRFSLHDYTTDKGFECPHLLVYLNDSQIIGTDFGECRCGIYVDVLPLDICPNGKIKNMLHGKYLAFIKSIISNRNFRPGRSVLFTVMHRMISSILGFVSIDFLNHYQQKVMQKYNNINNATQWCSKASHYAYRKLCMPIEYFGKPTLVDFSNRQYYVPEKVELYLHQLFGDYMKLPPIENQIRQVQSVKYASWKNKDGEQIEIGSL